MPEPAEKDEARETRLPGPVRLQNRLNEHERKKNNKIALELCHPEAAAYAECIKGRTFSMVIYCREIFNELNDCLKLKRPG